MNTKHASSGYTLLEALVTLFIVAEILIATLVLFDFNSRVGRTQTQIAELQQGQRIGMNSIVRLARMAGRGSLPQGNLPTGTALAVRTKVPEDTHIAPADAASPLILEGTDVLTLRGVFTRPIYFINGAGTISFSPDTGSGVPGGSLQVSNGYAPVLGEDIDSDVTVSQDVTPLIEAITAERPEALVIASRVDNAIVAVVELDPANSSAGDPANLTIAFLNTGGTHTAAYAAAVPFPGALRTAVFVAPLDEYRFYLTPPDDGFDLEPGADPVADAGYGRRSPRLCMGRFYPFTDVPFDDDPANYCLELAENFFDLQFALGIDLNGSGIVDEAADLVADEWLFNVQGDSDDDGAPINPTFGTGRILGLRISTLAMTDRPDPAYRAPEYTSLEDRLYPKTGADMLVNHDTQRRFRRRTLQSIIDLRSL